MISFYNVFMYPLEKMGLRKARHLMMKHVHGDVLELGSGTGANLPFYDFNQINALLVTDKVRNRHLNHTIHGNIEYKEASAEDLPFDSNAFDVVVHTLVFCSVSNVDQGLQEIKRVLKASGKLIFIEHVLPEKRGLRTLFQKINPLWKKVSGGCSLTKDFNKSLERNGFTIQQHGKIMNSVFFYGIATVSTD